MKKNILSILICLPFLVSAGGFQLNIQGIKAIGMGGAFTGISSDPSTVFFNPGGMCNFNGHNFTFGVNLISPHVSLQTEVYSNINQTTGMATPIHFYYVGELNDKMRFGFLVNNQFGSSSSFEDDWQGRFIVQKISLKTFMFQPTMSYSLHEKISVGAGFVYTKGTFSYEKGVPVGSVTTKEGKAVLSGKGNGVGYNIGVFSNAYTLKHDSATTSFCLGVNYRSGIRINLSEGQAEFTDIPVSLQYQFPELTKFRGTLNLPSVLTVGFSVKHTKANYSIEFAYDYNYTGWSSYDTLAFDFVNEETPDVKTVKNWTNSTTHRIGLDFTYKNKYSVRVGLYKDQTPIPDGYLSPELPDVDQIVYTAGLGYKVNDKFTVEFSFLTLSSEFDASLNDANFSAKYRRQANVYGIALSIKLGGKKKKETTPSIN